LCWSLGILTPQKTKRAISLYTPRGIFLFHLHQVFEKQTELALYNLALAKEATGDQVDVVYLCGTDFGTQNSSFCSTETFNELFAPYYKMVNDWVHENTHWKTIKRCCGAIEPFLDHVINCGFDIINPVHNIQANVPFENVFAMLDAISDFR
jgi:hypothetical protein